MTCPESAPSPKSAADGADHVLGARGGRESRLDRYEREVLELDRALLAAIERRLDIGRALHAANSALPVEGSRFDELGSCGAALAAALRRLCTPRPQP